MTSLNLLMNIKKIGPIVSSGNTSDFTGSNLGLDTDYFHTYFSRFSSENVGIVPFNRPRQHPYTSYPIRYSVTSNHSTLNSLKS